MPPSASAASSTIRRTASGIGEVGPDGHVAGAREAVADGFGLRGPAPVVHGDAVAAVRERGGDGRTDPARTAGDEHRPGGHPAMVGPRSLAFGVRRIAHSATSAVVRSPGQRAAREGGGQLTGVGSVTPPRHEHSSPGT